jgi:hypothetical protein
MIRVVHPGSRIWMLTFSHPGSRIWMLTFSHPGSRIQGVKKAPNPGYRIRISNTGRNHLNKSNTPFLPIKIGKRCGQPVKFTSSSALSPIKFKYYFGNFDLDPIRIQIPNFFQAGAGSENIILL